MILFCSGVKKLFLLYKGESWQFNSNFNALSLLFCILEQSQFYSPPSLSISSSSILSTPSSPLFKQFLKFDYLYLASFADSSELFGLILQGDCVLSELRTLRLFAELSSYSVWLFEVQLNNIKFLFELLFYYSRIKGSTNFQLLSYYVLVNPLILTKLSTYYSLLYFSEHKSCQKFSSSSSSLSLLNLITSSIFVLEGILLYFLAFPSQFIEDFDL
ncbi:transmembrane protein, putative (macronuclear) [Tetrahymena thermophila SB210]|uniref:Transmembrane protein, putative n=1 Tax=Tetrahymena thermophila (strain SB210) TaxID=312017 RepID=W7XLB1_TETTS|nr:transmembrane protein, putative [Tetrahymena thermophila SB210]EWS75979.1 transmembrane protein, putative [Tetrahymena thermophila SB210]|eukprot:XP_012651497.1 transmembrane protein, putative [Tetrahymena thermophila SB210]